jgi:hypothetical protein
MNEARLLRFGTGKSHPAAAFYAQRLLVETLGFVLWHTPKPRHWVLGQGSHHRLLPASNQNLLFTGRTRHFLIFYPKAGTPAPGLPFSLYRGRARRQTRRPQLVPRWLGSSLLSGLSVRYAMLAQLPAPDFVPLFFSIVVPLGGALVWALWELEQLVQPLQLRIRRDRR